jgi:hypothetical protein
MNLDELLEVTENLKGEINELNWHEDDVRHSFYTLFYSSLYQYYLGKSVFHLTRLISAGRVYFHQNAFDYQPHAQRLYEIPGSAILSTGYHGNLSRQVVLGSWTTFELSISLMFDFIVDEKEFDSMILSMNSKFVKSIAILEEINKELIMQILRTSAFVPLFRKFNFIVKQNKEAYGGDLAEDREFITFVNTLRNCLVHSNGYYHGKHYRFEIYETVFEFKNNEIFIETGENGNVYLSIALRLKEIFTNLCLCISSIENIPYPEDEINIA